MSLTRAGEVSRAVDFLRKVHALTIRPRIVKGLRAMIKFYTPAEFAQRPDVMMTEGGVRQKIRNGEIEAMFVGGHYLISAEAAERFLNSWPSRNKGVSARWRSYRAFKAAMLAAGVAA
jgi:excisionase family DNA binding protein